ncbi:MAG: response regulator transcription factor [Pedobacter sp.]|nr:MAG: response regulator transcription factor [Pedobacter sp.]
MQVLIVEDEMPAADRLQILLKEYDPSIQVVGKLQSIEETVAYLETHPHPDLMLLDIALSDGTSFEIFRRVNFQKPVVFTTAFDHFAMESFCVFSLHYIFDYKSRLPLLTDPGSSKFKSRFLAKTGQKLIFVDTVNIRFFEADNKIVYLLDAEGNRYVIEYTLERLEEVLDPGQFFRVNRSYLVNMTSIQHIKPYFSNRLKICLKGSMLKDDLIVSRDRVSQFKAWADE